MAMFGASRRPHTARATGLGSVWVRECSRANHGGVLCPAVTRASALCSVQLPLHYLPRAPASSVVLGATTGLRPPSPGAGGGLPAIKNADHRPAERPPLLAFLFLCNSAAFSHYLRSCSALPPQLFRITSAAVPHYLRTASALLPHCFRTASALLPHCFRTASALLAEWQSAPLWVQQQQQQQQLAQHEQFEQQQQLELQQLVQRQRKKLKVHEIELGGIAVAVGEYYTRSVVALSCMCALGGALSCVSWMSTRT